MMSHHGRSSSSDSTSDGHVTPDTEFDCNDVERSPRKRSLDILDHESPEAKRRPDPASKEALLCEHCQQIDFQKVVFADVRQLQQDIDGILLADLGTRCNALATAARCHLCHLFHQSRLQSKSSSLRYELRIYSYLKTSKEIAFGLCRDTHRAGDVPCIGVVPYGTKEKAFRLRAGETGRLFCRGKNNDDSLLFSPRILGPNADFNQVKAWLNFCASHHLTCENSEDPVAGLKLIDCNTHDVIPAPANASYTALSYVWGTSAAGHTEPAIGYNGVIKHDRRFTKTIRDAIVVTKTLGYSYLWVDKLCIDQADAVEMHHQISQMDAIYRSANVTIIAACGEDCHYGLPGVDGIPRSSQPVVELGQVSVFSSMTHPHHRIQSSTWAGRGWTLQEAVLSTRRLVFTDDCTYFECNSMHCSENILPNIDMIHDRKRNIYPCFQSGILSINRGRRFAGAVPKGYWEQDILYKSLVTQYTKRALTFEQDKPRAFAGIVSHFAKNDIHQIWGISYQLGTLDRAQEKFVKGLLWAHQRPSYGAPNSKSRKNGNIDLSLTLPGLEPIPSWSWMKWRGEIIFPHHSILINNVVHGIQFELGSSSRADLLQFHSAASVDLEKLQPFQMETPLVLTMDIDCVQPSQISLDKQNRLQVCGREASCYISRGPLDQKALCELLQNGKFELLYLAKNILSNSEYLMIVEKRTDLAMRVGLCITRGNNSLLQQGERKTVRLA